MPTIGRREIRYAELDFSTFIAERTRDFTGRRWVESAVDEWLADADAEAYFILTGDPGVGKSAFAAHSVRSRPNRFTAYHFCSARLGSWVDPVAFSRSISRQLSMTIEGFAAGLLDREGIHVNATQNIAHLSSGQAVNVLIENLEIAGPEEAFDRFVRAPIAAFASSRRNHQIVILVDGLDEALAYTGSCTIVDLLSRYRDFPPNLRFILTSRAERRVLRYWDDIPHFRIHAAGEENLKDIRDYVTFRCREMQENASGEIEEKVVSRSAGNFLYVSYLMDTAARDPQVLALPGNIPEGLDGVYRLFLNTRDIGRDLRRWEERYQPVLGILAVAREPLSEAALARFTGLDPQRVASVIRDLWQYLSFEPQEQLAFRIYHQSFVDFLLSRERSLDHWTDPQHWNATIARAYYPNGFIRSAKPSELDCYATRHLATHLGAGGLFQLLFTLVEDESWRRAKFQTDSSGAGYAADVDIAVMAASRTPGMIADLFAYSLLFAAATEPFTSASCSRLGEMIANGHAEAALREAAWMIKPLQRFEAYRVIGEAFVKSGKRSEAAAAWDHAWNAINADGNAINAAVAARCLCMVLFKLEEVDQATEILEGVLRHIRRIANDSCRLGQWLSLAWDLVSEGRKREAKDILEGLLNEVQFMEHRVAYSVCTEYDDPSYLYSVGVEARCEAIEKTAILAMEIDDAEWFSSVFSRLESTVAHIPIDSKEARSRCFSLRPPCERDTSERGGDSVTQARVRSKLKQLRGELEHGDAGAATIERCDLDSWLPWVLKGGSQRKLTEPSGLRDDALEHLNEVDVPAMRSSTPAEVGMSIDVTSLADHLGTIAKTYTGLEEIDEVRTLLQVLEEDRSPAVLSRVVRAIEAFGQHSTTWADVAAWTLARLGACEAALRALEDWDNNEDRADLWITISQLAVGQCQAYAWGLLETLADRCRRLWAREQSSRVLAGIACAYYKLGDELRAWETINRVEYQNIRVDAAIRLVWTARRENLRDRTLVFCRQLAASLHEIWAASELARGLLVVAASALWAGDVGFADDAIARLGKVLDESPRLTRKKYRSFVMESAAEWNSPQQTRVRVRFSPEREELHVEEALASLVPMGRQKTALELFTRMQTVLDPLATVRLMAVEALEQGDSDLYRSLIRLYSGLQEVEPEFDWHGPDTRQKEHLIPELPRGAGLERAFRWLRTGLLAARHEGREEVWCHTYGFAPLLSAFPPGTAARVRERLLAVEGHQPGTASGPSQC